MKLRRTISIDKNDLEVLKPLLDSNGNNLSQALRQLIENYRLENSTGSLSEVQQKKMVLRNQIIENKIATLIPVPLVKWLVRRSPGVPPLGTFRIIIEKYMRLLGKGPLNLEDYIDMVNNHAEIFGYQMSQHIEFGNSPDEIRIMFETEDSEHLKRMVMHYSCMLAHNPIKLKTIKVVESPGMIIIEYKQCSSEKEAYGSVLDHFGHDQVLAEEINNNIHFWRKLAGILRVDNYEDIIISRDMFLQLFKSQHFSEQLNNLISIIYNVPIGDIDGNGIVRYLDEICRIEGFAQKIEYNDDEIRIFHTFNDKDVIQLVNESIINLLALWNHSFKLKRGDKMTVLYRS